MKDLKQTERHLKNELKEMGRERERGTENAIKQRHVIMEKM